MDKEKIDSLKNKLQAQKKQLEEDLKDIAVKDKNLKDDYDAKFKNLDSGPMDQSAEAMEVSEYQDNLSVEANLEMQLRDVNNALEKIEKGEFGKCEKCQGEISGDRLEALPHAKTCLNCAKS